ncbi:MAG: DNA internalization-related competence protein ComEC/Rec2 [Porticoccaceae bacterium]
MPYLLLAFALGSYSSVLWPALPPLMAPGAVLLLCVVALAWRRGRMVALILLGVSAGVCWATLWGQVRLAAQLPAALDKTEYRVEGTVVGLPSRDARATHFELLVSGVEALTGAAPPSLRRVRLSWYGQGPEVAPGETWRLLVRLRRPRGFANPGGFDYAGWLFSRGISATGYVRDSPANRRLSGGAALSIDAWRARVAAHIEHLPVPVAGRALLRAFTVGDDRAISGAMWERMRVAGVVHLAVISGLHIALAAGFGMVIGTLGGRVAAALGAPWPARHAGALTAWIAAALYTLMAGGGLATARAFIMLTVFLVLLLLRRHRLLFGGFIWALAAIAVVEPLAPMAAGFWLSFGAVAVLLAWFGPRSRRSRIQHVVGAQLAISLGTAAGLLAFFGKLPLLAPPINLLAIPWVEILTVPFCLLGVVALPMAPVVADWCWWIAGWSLQWFDTALATLAPVAGGANWVPAGGTGWPQVSTLVLAGLLMLAPRGLRLRYLSGIALLALALAGPGSRPALRVTVLDVGQGLAVVVETQAHVMVYDTGAAFSDRFDAGDGIIAPYLRARGWPRLNLLVVSHRDADHSGGEAGLLRNFPPERQLRGLAPEGPGAGAVGCRRGQHWRWDGVEFRILHPTIPMARENDQSCVLLVEAGAARVLLTGDIESRVEALLLADAVLPGGIELLVAPHHGSRTSSSPDFVARVRPAHVVYSAGYHHHFGHPHPQVVARYEAVGARGWNTALDGALSFTWQRVGIDPEPRVDRARRNWPHYWERD